jgi:hypothetical protein
MFPVYFAFALTTLIGVLISKKENVASVAIASVSGSVIFFLITNLVFFYQKGLYELNLQGQINSYTAAIPFFRNTLLSDLFFNAFLFGAWHLIVRNIISVQKIVVK